MMQADSAPGSTIGPRPSGSRRRRRSRLCRDRVSFMPPLTIEGPAATVTIVCAAHQSRALSLDPSVAATISGLSITGGLTTGYGGGVDVGKQSSLVENCTISGSSAKRAAGPRPSANRARWSSRDLHDQWQLRRRRRWGRRRYRARWLCTMINGSSADAGGEDFSAKARPRLRTARSPGLQPRSLQSSPPIRPSL